MARTGLENEGNVKGLFRGSVTRVSPCEPSGPSLAIPKVFPPSVLFLRVRNISSRMKRRQYPGVFLDPMKHLDAAEKEKVLEERKGHAPWVASFHSLPGYPRLNSRFIQGSFGDPNPPPQSAGKLLKALNRDQAECTRTRIS